MFKLIYKLTDKIKEKVGALSDKLSEKGQGLTEYAIILAAVAIIAVVALYTGSGNNGGLKNAVETAFGNATSAINEANTNTTSGTGTGTGTGTGG